MLSRRDLVGKLAAGAAVVCAAGAAGASVAPTFRREDQPAGTGNGEVSHATSGAAAAPVPGEKIATLEARQPWELLAPLAVGASLANGWRVSALSGAVDGSCVVTVENERGRAHRVHICRNDGSPQGLVYTHGLDLVVMNGGRGDLPTEEGLAQAVAEMAHVIAQNENHHPEVVAALLPQAERVRRFSGPVDWRLR
jgi:hypothetical protein